MGHAKKVMLMVGFVPIATRMEVAVDPESSGTHAVCIGTEGEPHDPARVKQSVGCPICERTHSSVFGFSERAVEVGDSLVVLSAEEMQAAAGTARTGRAGTGRNSNGPQPPIQIAFHRRDEVYGATVAADSVQNIYPDRGGEKAYMLLRDALTANPDVAAVMIWAPASKNALWVLGVTGDRITATKRCWPEQVRATEVIPDAEITDAERLMFSQLVASTVEDFDLTAYVDESKRGLEELVNSKAGEAVSILPSAPSGAGGTVVDLVAAIQASLAAAGAKPTPPKKAPAKKAAAKKAPAKKAAAKKAAAPRKTAKKVAA